MKELLAIFYSLLVSVLFYNTVRSSSHENEKLIKDAYLWCLTTVTVGLFPVLSLNPADGGFSSAL